MTRTLIFASLLFAICAAGRAAAGTGDLTNNGALTQADVGLLRDALLGKITLTAVQQGQADMNGDGKVDVGDLVQMVLANPPESATNQIGTTGGQVAFDGSNVTLPAGLMSASTTVTLTVPPAPPVLGQEQTGAILRISIPLDSIDRAKLSKAADEARQRRALAYKHQGGAYKMEASISDLVVNLSNGWNTTVGSFYIAAEYVQDTGERAFQAVLASAVSTALVTGRLTAEAFDAMVAAAEMAGKTAVEITMTLVRGVQSVTGSPKALLEWTNPSGDYVSSTLQAKKNIVICVHGIISTHYAWRQVVAGLIGDNGNAIDPALKLAAGSLGVWVYEFDYKDSTQSNGADLDTRIDTFVQAHAAEIDNIFLVAHSQGGLIVRRALESAENGSHGWLNKVRAVAYLGSMNAGTDLEAAATMLLNYISLIGPLGSPAASLNALLVDTPGMQDLAANIPASVGVPAATYGIRAYLLGSDKPSKLTNFYFSPDENDGWVPLNSALDQKPVVDFPGLSLANKKEWANNSGGIWSQKVLFGGHVILFPNDDEPGGAGRKASAVRTDERYDTLRNYLMPQQGTITIDVTPDAAGWTLTGPAGFATMNDTGDRLGTGAITGAPVGDYTLTCKALTGYTPPAKITKTLTRGGAAAFTATWAGSGGQTLTLNLPGGVPLVMIKCPAGSFQMGSPDTERSRWSYEGPVHTVNISQAFYLGKYEVTQKQWLAVMGSWPGSAPSSTYGVGDSYPAYRVSWNDIAGANGFIDKLNAHLAATGQGGGARLPSEAEWEYACRAGTTTRFYFGDSLSQSSDYGVDGPTDSAVYPGNRSDYMWFGGNSSPYGTKPVGTKRPNAWGLDDMAGNVWEWCQDWYGSYSSGSANDPTGPVSGSSRVVRGGSWFDAAHSCRSAYRYYYDPDYRSSPYGFRLARTN